MAKSALVAEGVLTAKRFARIMRIVSDCHRIADIYMSRMLPTKFNALIRKNLCKSMRFFGSLSVCGILLFALLPFFSSNAAADFRVCNATQRKVGVAVGYRTKTGWISEGWWQIEAASCKSLIEGALSSRFYYLYAEDSDGVERWNGSVNMCVSENEFKIDGVGNCFPRGFQKFGFREIDTQNQANWMVRLTDISAENKESGIYAGQSSAGVAKP